MHIRVHSPVAPEPLEIHTICHYCVMLISPQLGQCFILEAFFHGKMMLLLIEP